MDVQFFLSGCFSSVASIRVLDFSGICKPGYSNYIPILTYVKKIINSLLSYIFLTVFFLELEVLRNRHL